MKKMTKDFFVSQIEIDPLKCSDKKFFPVKPTLGPVENGVSQGPMLGLILFMIFTIVLKALKIISLLISLH